MKSTISGINAPKLSANSIKTHYALVAMEKSLLFHGLQGDFHASSYYLSQGECCLEKLNPQLFWHAWQQVIQHFEVLRSCFQEDRAGLMKQVVYPHIACAMNFINLDAMPHTEVETTYQNIRIKELQTPFNVTEPPLMRLVLCQMPHQEYRFLWTYHHLLCDLRSALHIFDQVMNCYQAALHHQAISLAPAVTKDVILEKLSTIPMTQAKSYWQTLFKDYEPTDQLPLIGSSNKNHDSQEALEHHFMIDAAQYFAIKQFAYQYGLTPSLLAHTAWGLTLCSYLNRDDIAFGTIRSLPYALVKKSAGLFVNNLPMRIRYHQNTTVLDLLSAIRDQYRQLKPYWNTSLGDIHAWMGHSPEQPLFNTYVSFSTQESNELITKHFYDQFQQLQLKFRSTIHYPLMLEFFGQEHQLLARLTASQELFSHESLNHLSDQFTVILQCLIQNPQKRISQLSWSSERDLKELNKWNQTHAFFPDVTLTTLLKTQIEKIPQEIAVEFEDQTLSYQELNLRANQLAHELRHQGVKPNTTIAIYMERCLELPVALLGIVKSGGAYLPLDPKIPLARLNEILIDSQTSILLTTTQLRKSLAALSVRNKNFQIIELDRSQVFSKNSEKNLDNINSSHDDLYVIYTSGSTGKPKGVRVPHRGVVNQLLWMQKTIPLQKDDKVLQKTTISFDVSIWEFFWPWLAGARVILAPPDAQYDVDQLISIIKQKKITTIQFVPTQLEGFIQNAHANSCQSLRHIISIGEALKQKVVENCLAAWPNATFYNLYGPTETSIASTYYLCLQNDSEAYVPIGRPIDNTQLFVINSYRQPVPIGGIGELYIGGVGITKGYLNRPELTAQCFVENPQQNSVEISDGKILYKTGDWVKWSLAGELHFLGRIDNQVKRHGIRVELSEIENQLLRQENIHQCVVMTEKNQGQEYLIAYCVGRVKPKSTLALRQSLAQYLPDYMIPTHFVWLESLPLLANGKLNRAALPGIDIHQSSEKLSHEKLDINLLEKLKTIWQEVLRLDSVGPDDNLFALGGDSISVMQIANKARAAEIEIKPQWIFKHPSIKSLAKLIMGQNQSQNGNYYTKEKEVTLLPQVALAKSIGGATSEIYFNKEFYGIKDIYSLSPTQRGILFHSLSQGSHLSYMTQLTLHLSGSLKIDLFREVLEETLSPLDLLRTGFFIKKNGTPLQIVYKKLPFSIHSIDLRNEEEPVRTKKLNRYLKRDRLTPFEMDIPPLFRLSLFVLEDSQYLLIYTCHHIISDGWSISLLFNHILKSYHAKLIHAEKALTPLYLPYADYIDWTERQSQENAQAYWKALLSAFDAPVQLDIEKSIFSEKKYQPFKFARKKIIFGKAFNQKIRAMVKEYQITLHVLIQSVWALMLKHYSHQQNIVFGTVISGRSDVELDHIESRYGLFAKVIPTVAPFEKFNTIIPLCQFLLKQLADSEHYSHYPLSHIQADVYQGQSLFNTLLAFENYPLGSSTQQPLDFNIDRVEIYETTHYALNAFFFPKENEIEVELVYNTQCFSHKTIAQFSFHLKNLLEAIVADIHQPIQSYSLLSLSERKKLLTLSNHFIPITTPHHQTLNDLIAIQAKKHPHKIAIQYQTLKMTYEQLIRHINSLSAYLHDYGIKPGDVVALIFKHHPDALIAMLACLKLGCTYLPISPNSSLEYCEYLITDSQAQWVLTHQKANSRVNHPQIAGKPVIVMDHFYLQPLKENDFPTSTVHTTAYILYTSGSTRKPKGVAIRESAILDLLYSINQVFHLNDQDAFVAFSAFIFDISVVELYLPLLMGGTCIILPTDEVPLHLLLKQIQTSAKQVFIQTTPSLWSHWLDTDILNHPSVKIISTGEALPTSLANRLIQKNQSLWNCYGPTETTVFATAQLISSKKQTQECPIASIGKPLATARTYVLDKHLSLVPIGVSGELYIGGSGVMQGYIGEAEKPFNHQKLIPNPFKTGELLYKTGDKVCWLPDGNLQFLERFDDQVKIRGLRVDLNQVASVLETHPWVREALVLKQEQSMMDAALMAYLLMEDQRVCSDLPIEQIHSDQWAVIYDRLYQQSALDTPFDTTGWTSSYTGKALSKEDMQEWVQQTVDQINALSPQRILEIGCGTGLLLFPLTPHCQSYHGIDFSAAALAHIQEQLKDQPFKNKVSLSQGSAHAFQLNEVHYDTVVINSVIQYFPHIDYLIKVLDHCLSLVTDGGQIWVGDVRNLRHLKHFHATAIYHRTASSASLSELMRRYFKALHREKELLVDPMFFMEYAQCRSRISHVDIRLKMGACHNEMNDFRYDVILHINKKSPKTLPKEMKLDWREDHLALDKLASHLKSQPSIVSLSHILHSRWKKAHQMMGCLEQSEENLSLSECRELLILECSGFSPAELQQQISENYDIFCVFSPEENTDSFDAVLRLRDSKLSPYCGQVISHQTKTQPINWQHYANKPWQVSCYKEIFEILHQHLLDKLPHYMTPSSWIFLDEIPTTKNGKLDRKALAHYEATVTTDYQAAQSDIEQTLIHIWQETLGVRDIGTDDNFFQLGGHSLNALHVIHEIEQRWSIHLDVIRLFEAPTISQLAHEIQERLSQTEIKQESSYLVALSPAGHKPPLFLIHPVGGTVFCYMPLVEHLAIDHPIIGIQDPGITTPEHTFNSLVEMATYYIQLIKTKQPVGPYYLAGASLGGTLAVEISRQLQKQGDQVNFLGLFDTWAAFTEAFNSRERLEKTLCRQYHFLKKRLKDHDIANPQSWLDLNYQRLQLLLQYSHPEIQTPIHLFKAQDIEPEYQDLDEPSNHWSQYAKQPMTIYSVPGNHESLLVEPHVKILAQLLTDCLEKIDQNN